MIRSALAVPLALLLSACAVAGRPSGTKPSVAEQEIRARGAAMMALENARDLEAALAFYTTDAVVQAPGAPTVVGLDSIRAMYVRNMDPRRPQATGSFTDRTIWVAASGELAWEHGNASTTIAVPNGGVSFSSKQLIVWRKVDGEWRVAAMSFSANTPPPGRPAGSR